MSKVSKSVEEQKIKTYLLLAAISCFLYALIFPISSIIEIPFGIVFLYCRYQNVNKLAKAKTILLIMALILLIPNLLSAILLFITVDTLEELKKTPFFKESNTTSSLEEINQNSQIKEKKEKLKPKISPELRKIDILLKLGLGMVITSGLLFATTSWELITDQLKVVFLVIIAILFLVTSIFSEKKLHIENTTFTYWLLSSFFFIFAMISIGTLAIFGETFSYTGLAKNLMYALTYALISIFAYLTYLKKPNNIFIYIAYATGLITLYNFFRFFTMDSFLATSIITLIILLVNKETKRISPNLRNFNKYISYYIAFITISLTTTNQIISLLGTTLNIINLLYVSKQNTESSKYLNIISTILNYNLISKCINTFNLELYQTPLIIIVYTIFALIVKSNKNIPHSYQKINQIFYYIYTIFAILLLETSKEMTVISSLIILFTNIFSLYQNSKDDINIYIQPIIIIIALASITNYLNQVFAVNFLPLSALIITYILIFHFTKSKKLKKVYYYSSFIILIASLFKVYNTSMPLTALITTSGFIYHFLNEETSSLKITSYIFILVSIFTTITYTNIIPLPIIYTSLITLWLYTLINYFQEEGIYKNITSFAQIIISYIIISNLTISYEYLIILKTTLYFYILYLIIKLFVKEQKDKSNMLSIISIFLLLSILKPSLIIGIYIGIVSLIMIIFSYSKKEYKNLFLIGIIITIINIIYQLQNLWTKIPFWLYLLITGLGLIIFVTSKELKERSNINTIKKENVPSEKFKLLEEDNTKKQ